MASNQFIYLKSFNSGELSPTLYGNIDINAYASGLELCENFEVLPEGTIQNRSGFKYIIECKKSDTNVVLIPFSFSVTQTAILEFGDQYVRFHINGQTLLESTKTITAITAASPAVVTSNTHGYLNGDWIYITNVLGMTEINGRYFKVANKTTNTFELTKLDGTNLDASGYTTYVSAGTAAKVYELTSVFTSADLYDIHYTQSNDVITLVHPSHPVQILRRLSATSWSITAETFGTSLTTPSQPTVTALPTRSLNSKDIFHRYCITAVSSTGDESLQSLPAISTLTRTISAATRASPGVITVSDSCYTGSLQNDTYGTVAFWLTISGVVGMTQLNGNTYFVDTQSGAGPYTLTLKDEDGVILNTTAFTAYTSGGTATLQGTYNDLTKTGRYNELKWTVDTSIDHYNIYKETNGIFGYIGKSINGVFVDNNIIPNIGITPPIQSTIFNSSDNYPGAVAYYQQRKFYAATNDEPHSVWATQPASEKNFNVSLNPKDDDGLNFKINGRLQNTIKHLIPLSELLVLTDSNVSRVSSTSNGVLTPSSISDICTNYTSSGNVVPAITENSVLYITKQSDRVKELIYSWEQQAYLSTDASLLAYHLFKGYTITNCSYQSTPTPIFWAIRSDGTLLGMTYVPDQKIKAWHQHSSTNGLFKSVCVITEGSEDVLYCVIERTINNRTVKYIERKNTRLVSELTDSFFVDAGLIYDGDEATFISGLDHLEGETVTMLADGAVLPTTTVSDGSVTLPYAASIVAIGLPITSTIKTLPTVNPNLSGYGLALIKNINKAYLRVNESSNISVGPDLDHLELYRQRSTEPYGSPPALTGNQLIQLNVQGTNTRDAVLYVQQTDPLPITLVAMVIELTYQG